MCLMSSHLRQWQTSLLKVFGNIELIIFNVHCYNYIWVFSVASVPSNLMAVQEGLTNVSVSWSPPSPLRDTTGYRISYSGGSSGSVNISNGSADNYLLTGLVNGASYTISIVGTSLRLPSEVVDVDIGLGE